MANNVEVASAWGSGTSVKKLNDTSNDSVLAVGTERVGVGTASPAGLVHTYSDDFGLVLQTSSGSNKRMQLLFWDSSGTQTARIGNDVSAANDSKLGLVAGNGTTPQVVLDDGGNTGIGTTGPSCKLELYEESSSDTEYTLLNLHRSYTNPGDWKFVVDTNAALRIHEAIGADLILNRTGGRIGIGTTSPEKRLDIGDGTGTHWIRVYGGYSEGDVVGMEIKTSGNSCACDWSLADQDVFEFGPSSGHDLDFKTGDETRITIAGGSRGGAATTGDVGIGVTSPDEKLDVDGVIRTRERLLIDDGNAPGSSVGASGDKEGMIAWDDNYIYVCKQDYDGSSNIWLRTALSGGSW